MLPAVHLPGGGEHGLDGVSAAPAGRPLRFVSVQSAVRCGSEARTGDVRGRLPLPCRTSPNRRVVRFGGSVVPCGASPRGMNGRIRANAYGHRTENQTEGGKVIKAPTRSSAVASVSSLRGYGDTAFRRLGVTGASPIRRTGASPIRRIADSAHRNGSFCAHLQVLITCS